MPSIPKRVHVVKIPKSSSSDSSSFPQKVMPEFDRMPRMYLELLENKDKIRPHLVNKEYDPEEASSVYSFDLQPTTAQERSLPMMDKIEENKDDVSLSSSVSDQENDDKEDSEQELGEEEDEESRGSEQGSEKNSKGSLKSDDQVSSVASESVLSRAGTEERSHRSSVSSSRSLRPPLTSKEEEVKNRTKEKLKQLLFSEERQVPTLAELKKRGEVKQSGVIADLGRMDGERLEEEDELKRELLFKFELLKKSYKHVHVPEFTMHSDYRNMNQTYENTLRQVSLDSNVESYKSLLVGGFMLLEFILGFWLKFDMSGFTQQQILNMNQYERLLIELGEKSYVPGGSQWPVEIRLLGLIIMNAIIFIISKMILKKTGSNLVGLMNSVNTVMGASHTKPKRKMRGPNVDLDAIPEVGGERDGGGGDGDESD